MSFFDVAEISSSGMSAERMRMDVISNNIANSETTRTEDGGPFKRKNVIVGEKSSSFSTMFSGMVRGSGVDVSGVVEDESAPRLVFDPGHPDADENGNVAYPNISVVNEMVDMISASRGYEANLMAFNMSKTMALKSLDIGRA